LQGELSILFQWLSGKADRTGTRMAGPPVCGSQPRCSECPLVAYCSTARVPVEVVYSRSESCASAAAAYSPVEPAPPAESPTEPPTVRIIDLPQEQRPRERLMRGDTLDAMELLAIIIKSGTMNHSALDVARLVMRRFPTLTLLKDAGIDDLAAIPGMGAAKAATVKAALELGKRVHWNGGDALPPEQNESLTSAKLIFQRYAPKFLGLRLEMFYMVALDTRLRPIREVEVATGNINSVPIHPREVFNEAIKARAYKVLLMHNHPGADPTPSASDRHVTTRLAEAGQVLGIPVMDHVIIAGDRFFSFFENGLMPSPMP
jgi:DNA repair protein RadC